MLKYFRKKSKSKAKPAIFLHIQKTAGSSLVTQAREVYDKRILGWDDFIKMDRAEMAAYPFISSHMGFDFAAELMEGRYSFTFVRNPVERLISLYRYYRRDDKRIFPITQVARENSFSDFLRICASEDDLADQVWNNQTWQLAHGNSNLPNKIDFSKSNFEQYLDRAKRNLRKFSHVGRFENFAVDAKLIYQELEWGQRPVLWENAATTPRPSNDEVYKDSGLIEDLTKYDMQLYQYVLRGCAN